jgi:hypothetical protein
MSTQKLDREVLSGEEGGEPGERGTGVRMGRRARHEKASLPGLGLLIPASSEGATFSFSTGNPDGLMAMASRPSNGSQIEIEAADDFVTTLTTTIDNATFTGLIPAGALLSSVQQVDVEIYRVFPLDSTIPPSGHVPTRVNSPSDNALDFRSTAPECSR